MRKELEARGRERRSSQIVIVALSRYMMVEKRNTFCKCGPHKPVENY